MKDKTALVFTGGKGPAKKEVEEVLKRAEISVAADSGWDLAKRLGMEPDFFIGDMDSVEDFKGLEKIKEDRKIIYPVDKDYTDTELALKFMDEREYRDIVLIGGGGGRIDHLIAIMSIINNRAKPMEWYTSREHIVFVEGENTFKCRTGQTISIFPCGESKTIISTEGLKWDLENAVMNNKFFSISNIALTDHFNVKLTSGAVLIIFNY